MNHHWITKSTQNYRANTAKF